MIANDGVHGTGDRAQNPEHALIQATFIRYIYKYTYNDIHTCVCMYILYYTSLT